MTHRTRQLTTRVSLRLLPPVLLVTSFLAPEARAQLLTCQAGATPADATDLFKLSNKRPNIGLLLDTTCSMGGWSWPDPPMQTNCTYYAARYTGGNTTMTKIDVVKAVLTGCQSASDGVIDRWASQVNFAIWQFNGNLPNEAQEVTPFNTNAAAMKAGVLALPFQGNTPMAEAMKVFAKTGFQSYFNDSNTASCQPTFMLMLSDGKPNPPPDFSHYDFACDPAVPAIDVAADGRPGPADGAAYMHDNGMLCNVRGRPNIGMYSIAFGAPGSFDPITLSDIAQAGGGQYFYAAGVDPLNTALQSMIYNMLQRSGVFYSPLSVERSGLFSDNIAYASSFKSNPTGSWYGNVKKYCIEPRKNPNGLYDPTDTRCIFLSRPDGKTLLTNPSAQDIWTNTTTTTATQGGAGLNILTRLGTPGAAPAAPFRPRNIVTWRSGTAAYVPVQPDQWFARDSGTSGSALNASLINSLHGYTYDADIDGNPTQVATWPLGDPIDSETLLLRYGRSCETPGSCFVVTAMNDGMIHFFDAANGTETTALIPAELWQSVGTANNLLRDIRDQPGCTASHRFYVDGGATLMHVDANGDGIIQPTETAYLLFGLGRGGSAYYQIPVNRLAATGVLDPVNNAVRPLAYTPNTAFSELRDTWATPTVGLIDLGGTTRKVAVFPSGHIGGLDLPGSMQPALAPSRYTGSITTNVEADASCPSVASFSGINDPTPCGNWDMSGLGYNNVPAQSRNIGPYTQDRAYQYDITLNLDLNRPSSVGSSDTLSVLDGSGRIVECYYGCGLRGRINRRGACQIPLSAPAAVACTGGQSVTVRVTDPTFNLRWFSRGSATGSHAGWQVTNIHVFSTQVTSSNPVRHYPTIYMVDAEKWNASTPAGFAGGATDDGLLLKISNRCQGGGINATCLDGTSVPDLLDMTCPISTPVSTYYLAGRIQALYWGDECGQIWKAWRSGIGMAASWRAQRLIALNRTVGRLQSPPYPLAGNQSLPSTNFRKLYRRLDLVPTQCPGNRAVGVYFGTGNVQRPLATDELQDPSLNNGRELIGVVWDNGSVASGKTDADLVDVTGTAVVNPKGPAFSGKIGWYIRLRANEKALRDPLVFQNSAFWKTFTPNIGVGQCSISNGTDTIYAVDNCTAAAVNAANPAAPAVSERIAWTGQTDVGAGILLVTGRDSPPIISHGDLSLQQVARLTPTQLRVPKLYMWREPSRQ